MNQVVSLPQHNIAGNIGVAEAAAMFLDERDLTAATRLSYRKTLDAVGAALDGPVDAIAPRQLVVAVGELWDTNSPSAWNRNIACLRSFFGWCARQGFTRSNPALALEYRNTNRNRNQDPQVKAIPKAELEIFLRGADHPLRERLFWWMLYQTAARASELLSLNIEDIDFARRRATIIGKGGATETIWWEQTSARLLPRYIKDRRSGPLFLTERKATPGTAHDPVSNKRRLSYRRAATLFAAASGGWSLHQLRHSALTHLAEAQLEVPMLLAKSRHRDPKTLLGVYALPNIDAVQAQTARLMQ